MRNSSRAIVAVLVALASAACSNEEQATSTSVDAAGPAPRTPPIEPMAQSPTADEPTRTNPRAPSTFACTDGRTVDIGDLVAIVSTTDGGAVQIARDPDDAFRFQSGAMGFRMKDDKGELAQGDGKTIACTSR